MFSCLTFYDFPGSSAGKGRRHWFKSWVGKTHWHRQRLPTPVFSGFPGSSAGKENACNVGDLISTPGWGRFPGEGNDYPPQCSGLENSIDCVVYGVTKTWTLLSDFHFHLLLYWYIVALQCFTLWKMAWRFLKKLKIELPYNPAIPLLDICPERDTCFMCSLQHFLQQLGHGSNLNVHGLYLVFYEFVLDRTSEHFAIQWVPFWRTPNDCYSYSLLKLFLHTDCMFQHSYHYTR